MQSVHAHPSYEAIVKRLRRASGHLHNVIGMMESESPCADVAQQLQAVERALQAAKRVLVHEHLDHCLDEAMQRQPAAHREGPEEVRQVLAGDLAQLLPPQVQVDDRPGPAGQVDHHPGQALVERGVRRAEPRDPCVSSGA